MFLGLKLPVAWITGSRLCTRHAEYNVQNKMHILDIEMFVKFLVCLKTVNMYLT